MEAAWRVFNPSGAEAISADEFKLLLPLLGEDVEEEMVSKARRGVGCRALSDACWCIQIEQLFEQVDEDGSGEIEFEEFWEMVRGGSMAAACVHDEWLCVQVCAMNPKGGQPTSY